MRIEWGSIPTHVAMEFATFKAASRGSDLVINADTGFFIMQPGDVMFTAAYHTFAVMKRNNDPNTARASANR